MNRLLLALIAVLLATPALAEDAPPPAPAPTFAGPGATIVSIKDNTPIPSPNGKAELLRVAQGANAFVAMLQMKPGAVVPVHRDATEEYILFMGGGGIMTIDGVTTEVSEGHAIYMAPNAEVTFTAGADGALVFQVFAGPEPSAKYDSWGAAAAEEPAEEPSK